jgi:cell division protein FtsB
MESEIPTSDVLTREQMTAQLRRDVSAATQAAEKYAAEEAAFEYKTRRMHYISDEMHEASFQEYAGPVDEAEAAALRVAGAVTRNARAVRAQLAETIAVSDQEMAAAAQRQTMIAGEVERLPLPRLAEDVRVAIMRDDRPAMYLEPVS